MCYNMGNLQNRLVLDNSIIDSQNLQSTLTPYPPIRLVWDIRLPVRLVCTIQQEQIAGIDSKHTLKDSLTAKKFKGKPVSGKRTWTL